MFKLIKNDKTARRGEFITPHGTFQTPCFMNVATAGAIKGGLSSFDLKDIKCQVMLCNTYHLHVRTGDKIITELGGIHSLTKWDGPIGLDGWYLHCELQISITEVSTSPLNYSVVKQKPLIG